MKLKFILILVCAITWIEAEELDACPVCDPDTCDSVGACLAGTVPDACGCCQVCGRSEGELCDLNSGGDIGICGDNLMCTQQKYFNQFICTCEQKKMVCGNDGLTYSSPCQLNEESVRRMYTEANINELRMENWGPCISPPIIVTPPFDTFAPIGHNITLDCEAKGFPAPVISWQYETISGDSISLPSDDEMISVQMRGGPEPYMATGWAQILSLDPTYSGTYHCIASNSEGKVHASAKVGVYNEPNGN